jgi:hypothetical protein
MDKFELVEEFNKITLKDNILNPSKILIDIIDTQKLKEEKSNIWIESIYKNLSTLEINNVGNVGEMLIQKICQECNIHSNIDGTKTKQIGGGKGDGEIKYKSIEIKTARMGSASQTFQHELGEHPWISNYIIFIDISPNNAYITIFKNFSEKQYKEKGFKCIPVFPTKSITRRKGEGNFKLDTSIKINNQCVKNKYSIIITNDNITEIGSFINKSII